MIGLTDCATTSRTTRPPTESASGQDGQSEQAESLIAGRIDSDISGDVKAAKLRGLLVRQDFKCALSGRELTPSNVQADHIIPVSKGGSTDMSNVQLLTSEVNAAKGAMSQDEFVAMCCDIATCKGG